MYDENYSVAVVAIHTYRLADWNHHAHLPSGKPIEQASNKNNKQTIPTIIFNIRSVIDDIGHNLEFSCLAAFHT